MITAADARQLQLVGISPLEHYNAAKQKCDAAIMDHARRQKPNVDVLVFKLSPERVTGLLNDLDDRGFYAVAVERGSDTHVITISWDESMGGR